MSVRITDYAVMVKTLSHYDLILTVSKITLQGYTKDVAYIAVQGDYLHKSYF